MICRFQQDRVFSMLLPDSSLQYVSRRGFGEFCCCPASWCQVCTPSPLRRSPAYAAFVSVQSYCSLAQIHTILFLHIHCSDTSKARFPAMRFSCVNSLPSFPTVILLACTCDLSGQSPELEASHAPPLTAWNVGVTA